MKDRVFKAVGINFLFRGMTLVLGIVITPLLFRVMDKEAISGWLLIVNNIAFLALLDFGLTITLHRRIALTFGETLKEGATPDDPDIDERLKRLFATGNGLFKIRGLAALIIGGLGGYLYVQTLNFSPEVRQQILIGWLIMTVAHAIQISGSIWSAFLINTGHVALDTFILMMVTLADLLARIVVVLLGGGIIGLVIVSSLAVVSRRFISMIIARRRVARWVAGPSRFSRATVGSMGPAMLSAWLVTFGSFLTLRTDQYFVVSMLDPAQLSVYQATFQIFMTLAQFALICSAAMAVFMSHWWAAGLRDTFRTGVVLSLGLAMAILWIGGAALLAVGPSFFDLWLGRGNYVGDLLAILFLATVLVEVQSNVLLNADRTTENEVYARWVMLAGGLNVVITFVLTRWLGIEGVALGTLIAICLSTGWIALRNAQRRLGVSTVSTVVPLQIRTMAVAGVVYLAVTAVLNLGPELNRAGDVAVSCAIGIPALGAWAWFGVLSRQMRATLTGFAIAKLRALAGGK